MQQSCEQLGRSRNVVDAGQSAKPFKSPLLNSSWRGGRLNEPGGFCSFLVAKGDGVAKLGGHPVAHLSPIADRSALVHCLKAVFASRSGSRSPSSKSRCQRLLDIDAIFHTLRDGLADPVERNAQGGESLRAVGAIKSN